HTQIRLKHCWHALARRFRHGRPCPPPTDRRRRPGAGLPAGRVRLLRARPLVVADVLRQRGRCIRRPAMRARAALCLRRSRAVAAVQAGMPENCETGGDRSVPEDQIKAMLDIMPSRDLVIHEWKKHGTCSGLSVKEYFARIRALFAK